MSCPCGSTVPRYLDPKPNGFATWCISCNRFGFVPDEGAKELALVTGMINAGMTPPRALEAFRPEAADG